MVALSARYSDNLLVIANDLRNEIRDDYTNDLYEAWGTNDPATDWKLAATNCGNAVLEVAPHQLIIIEGLNYANDMSMIKDSPIKLAVDDRLVYSFHLYSWQRVTSYRNYDKYEKGLNNAVGYILEEGHDYTAPLWLGEFGENTQNNYWNFTI